VPVPPCLVDDLSQELVFVGLDPRITAPSNADVAILAKFDTAAAGSGPGAWSASGLYKSIRAFMRACALQLDEEDAAHVLQASALAAPLASAQ
jgi:hypothetical protein